MAYDVERLRGMSDEVLQKVSNAFDFGETLNVASMRQIVEILADQLEVFISQPDCDGDFEGDVWFGHPEKRTLGTHIWRAGAWHELPSELNAVISLLGQARSQRDANADLIATLRADLAKAKEALPSWPDETAWPFGTQVSKKSGSEWHGKIVGYYSTALTPRGYCVESSRERGSVQIYPEAALEELSHD